MADRMPAEIWIGGQVPKGLVPDLCDVIRSEHVSLEWGDARFVPSSAKDLLGACRENHRGVRLLWLCREEVSWGEFSDLEPLLQEHRIACTRENQGRYEYDPEIAEYRHETGLEVMTANHSSEPVVPVRLLAPAAKALAKGLDQMQGGKTATGLRSLKRTLRLLRKAMPPEVPPLGPFGIT